MNESLRNTLLRDLLLLMLLSLLLMLLPAGPALGEQPANLNRNYLIEEDYIAGLAALEGEIYLLKPKGLVRLHQDTGEEQLLKAPEGDLPEMNELLPAPGGLYGLETRSGAVYMLRIADDQVQVETLHEQSGLGQGGWMRAMYAKEGFIHCLFDREGVRSLELATGKVTRLEVTDVWVLAPWGEGFATVEIANTEQGRQPRLVAMDGAGKREPLSPLPKGFVPQALVAAPAGDALYALSGQEAYAWRLGQEPQKILNFPRGDTAGAQMLDDKRLMLSVDSTLLAVRAVDPRLNAGVKQLVALDGESRADDFFHFLKSHPEVDLSTLPAGLETAEEQFIRHMLTRSDEVDIYLLKDQNLISRIKKKGYALDLAASPEIARQTGELYPAFRELVTQGEGVYLLPKKLFLSVLGYDPVGFKAIGEEPPKTFAAFYDLCLRWQEGLRDKHPEWMMQLQFNAPGFADILWQHALEQLKAGEPLKFSTPELRKALEQFLSLEQSDPGVEQGQKHLLSLRDIPGKGWFEYLPLTFREDRAFALGAQEDSFTYYVVNPYSKHREEALLFMESHLKGLPAHLRARLFASADQPIESPEYKLQIERWEGMIAELDEAIAKAGELEKRELEAKRKQIQEQLISFSEGNRWAISQVVIAAIQASAGSVCMPDFNPLPVLMREYPDLFESWRDNPQFDLDKFLGQLDQMTQTALREDQ